jgi:hypothetical protein
VRVLEGLRVGVLFLSHLCVDEFRGDTGGGGGGRDGGDTGSSDTPTMPPFVVDAFAVGAGGGARGDAGAGLREAVAVAARVLQFQMAALTQVTVITTMVPSECSMYPLVANSHICVLAFVSGW